MRVQAEVGQRAVPVTRQRQHLRAAAGHGVQSESCSDWHELDACGMPHVRSWLRGASMKFMGMAYTQQAQAQKQITKFKLIKRLKQEVQVHHIMKS